jgi:hypothetical protein
MYPCIRTTNCYHLSIDHTTTCIMKNILLPIFIGIAALLLNKSLANNPLKPFAHSCTALHSPLAIPRHSPCLLLLRPIPAAPPRRPPKPPAPKLATRKLVSVPCGCWLCQLPVVSCQLQVQPSRGSVPRYGVRSTLPLNADEHLAGPIAPPTPH